MDRGLKTPAWSMSALACPACGTALNARPTGPWICSKPSCGIAFPLVEGVPILIHDADSVFRIEDYTSRRTTYFTPEDYAPRQSWLSRLAKRFPPPEIKRARSFFPRLADRIASTTVEPRILLIGAGGLGPGLETIIHRSGFRFLETDISIGPRIQLVCDAHHLPFLDGSFDAVFAQAVLEHVADPWQCVREIHRVLQPQGIVYAGTPFLQQVHGGAYDFTRFTYRGHRRLFRHFEELESGTQSGPGYVLAWSWLHFLDALTTNPAIRKGLVLFGKATSYWLKYIDAVLLRRPGSYDSASAFYFIGKRSESIFPDRDIVLNYNRNHE